jgi:hypothetical protein
VPGILKQPGAVVLIYSRIAQRKAAHAHQIMKREALRLLQAQGFCQSVQIQYSMVSSSSLVLCFPRVKEYNCTRLLQDAAMFKVCSVEELSLHSLAHSRAMIIPVGWQHTNTSTIKTGCTSKIEINI